MKFNLKNIFFFLFDYCNYTLLIVLFSSISLNAQDLNTKMLDAMQHTLDSFLIEQHINGMAASVQFPNDEIWTGGTGVSTFSPTDSISAEHIFAIASVTKTITAACILQLIDEGLLELDDKLYQWIPGFTHIDNNITIKELLQHRSGIADVMTNPVFQPTLVSDLSKIWSLENVISTFITSPLFVHGTQWSYSNTNYILLALIIESVTNNKYYKEFEKRFFLPYDLNSFALIPIDSIPNNIAHLWLDITGDGMVDDANGIFTQWNSLFSSIGPAGGYFALPKDLVQWIEISMSGTLHSANIWNKATETVETSLPYQIEYGLGLMKKDFDGHLGYGHGGDISYATSAFHFPSADLSIVVQSNDSRINSWQLITVVQELLDIYLAYGLLSSQQPVSDKIEVHVVPNPFSSKFTINWEQQTYLSFKLINAFGQPILHIDERHYSDDHTITIQMDQALKSGLYFLIIYENGVQKGIRKMVKK